MRRICRCQDKDLPSLYKCLRRVKEGIAYDGLSYWNEDYPLEEDLRRDYEDGRLYLVKDGARVIGAASLSQDIAYSFFPLTLSERKAVELLDKVGHKGEDILVISRLMIDPAYQQKGIGTEFLKAILSNYRHCSVLISIAMENLAAISFYKKNGFRMVGPYPFEYGETNEGKFALMSKMYKPMGLCKEPIF